MKKEDVGQTQVWKINGHLVVANDIDDALKIWRAWHAPAEPELHAIERISREDGAALMQKGEPALLTHKSSLADSFREAGGHTVAVPMPAVSATPANGVYPEENGVRIWKDGHTFLVPKDWNKGEWPLLNNKGYERSKKSKERLLTNELDVLLDWDFVAATKHIQELGTDIPLKEGEYMITGAVHLAMYEYRDALNKALRAMGAEEINFDEDCWFAQRYSAYSAWFFYAANGGLYNGNGVGNTNQVRAVSL